MEQDLLHAALVGNVAKMLSLLRKHPGINVNWQDTNQWTALHCASHTGEIEAVKALLVHPHVSVNVKESIERTPFSLACEYGRVSVVRVLLKDPRVDITLEDNKGRTPLWSAAHNRCCEVVGWLIASGRDLGDVENKKGKWGNQDYTAIEIARGEKGAKVVELLERFIANPIQTRHEVCVKLGFPDELAAELYAATVFLCDDLLQLKPALVSSNSPAVRFFAIAKRLPMELQMVLCHRVVGSRKQNILRKDSEAAFKSLAKTLLSPNEP